MANSTNTSMYWISSTMNMSTPIPIDICSLQRKTIQTAAFSFLTIFISITVIGNFLVTFIILMSPLLRRQTTFLFLASLAVADTLIGLTTMPINAKYQWNSGNFCMSKTVCWLYLFSEPFLSISSVLHLFVISLDRFISLKFVYKYNSGMTRKRVYYVILFTWLCAMTLSLSNILKWKSGAAEISYMYDESNYKCVADNRPFYLLMYIGCITIPIVIMMYTYTYVYHTAMRHIKEISRIEVSMNDVSESPVRMRERKLKERQFRTLRSIIIVFIVFIVCWIPTIVYVLTIFYGKELLVQYRQESWFVFLHFIFIRMLPPLNSTTNPFIYVLSNRQFRNVAKQLLWKMSPAHQNGSLSNMHSMLTLKAYSPKQSHRIVNNNTNELRTNLSLQDLKGRTTTESTVYLQDRSITSTASP